MKTISKFLAMFVFAVSAFVFVSCSEDDTNNSYDFVEVEIDGVTYTKFIDFHSNNGLDGELAIWYSYIELEPSKRESMDISLVHYDKMSDLAKCQAGSYRIDDTNDIKNFDISIDFIVGYDNYNVQKYNHIVTLIQRNGDGVILEGRFSGKIKKLNKDISGRYRITLDYLDVDTDEQFVSKYKEENNGSAQNKCNNEIMGYYGTLKNVHNIVDENSVTAYFDYNGETVYFKLVYGSKAELMNLIKTEGENAKKLFNPSLESPLIKRPDYHYEYSPGGYQFLGFDYNVDSLSIEDNSIIVKGRIRSHLEYIGWYENTTFYEDLIVYKIVIP